MSLFPYTYTQAALAEPGRVRLLHKARLLNDAKHAYMKAAQDADDDGLSAEEKRRKMIAAVPAYLKGRVERGEEELPKMEVGHSREENVFAAVVEAYDRRRRRDGQGDLFGSDGVHGREMG